MAPPGRRTPSKNARYGPDEALGEALWATWVIWRSCTDPVCRQALAGGLHRHANTVHSPGRPSRMWRPRSLENQARFGRDVKAAVFRLAYLIGVSKGRLRNARKRLVLIDGDTWKLRWPKEETKGKRHAHEVVLVGEELEIVKRAWTNRLPDCDFLFHIDGQLLGPTRSELEGTCVALGIPYGRGTGVVFHDTRHSAVTNLVDSGTGEAAAMSITGHADPSVFKRYHRRRDAAQAKHSSGRTTTSPPSVARRLRYPRS